MKLINLSSLLALAVLAGGIMLNSATAQAAQPPLWQLVGVGCLPEDAGQPANQAIMDGFCMDIADLFEIPWSHIVVTRCASDESAGSNRPAPFSPGAWCILECLEGSVEIQCSAFVNPGNNP